ncbi:MAG TPA: tripartite tricarboxylate transporter TctB family protein [Burkholderiaceae bacterium]|nr:tripartite tricarboxylate transporter TctB family protein [Burkholderiaceae bacterium]
MARRVAPAELAISLGVLVLGIGATVVAFQLPEAGGYARVGPNVMPKFVAGGLVLLGLWLLYETFSGGWRNRTPDDPAERGEHPFLLSAFAWVSAGLFAQMALIHTAGFIIAGVALFACTARGFGSQRWLRDVLIGLVLALGVFFFFVKFLNVNLPAGWLEPLLGRAGL